MNEFKFWDKYMYLDEEELKLFNFILQFDFGDGNREYSCEELKEATTEMEVIFSMQRTLSLSSRLMFQKKIV
jgi:hypothetical protein